MASEDSRPAVRGAASSVWRRFEPPLMPGPGLLDRLLERALPGARARHIEFLDGGVVNSNYRVDLDPEAPTRTVRLRLSRSAEAAAREAALAGRIDFPVPRWLAAESVAGPEPHTASLWSWIDGTPLDERNVDDTATGARLAEALGRAHDVTFEGHGRLHPDLAVANAAGFARPAARWLDDLAHRLAIRLENPAHGLEPARVAAVRAASARAMAPLWSRPAAPGRLVHGDLSPGNILLDAAGRVSGLLDWEMARAGDPAVDAASIDFELSERWPRLAAGALAALETRTPDEWPRRLDLARLPLLLDARMVAVARRSSPSLARVDERLEAIVARWAR
jgi:aminoglycoside phosphotransferase (APT) family kinase protein